MDDDIVPVRGIVLSVYLVIEDLELLRTMTIYELRFQTKPRRLGLANEEGLRLPLVGNGDLLLSKFGFATARAFLLGTDRLRLLLR